jgi:hypothetical protein
MDCGQACPHFRQHFDLIRQLQPNGDVKQLTLLVSHNFPEVDKRMQPHRPMGSVPKWR